jgi:hypothetical protein
MSKVIASPIIEDNAPANIVTLRGAVADALKRQYGATKEYAIALCAFLPDAWYDVEHNSLIEGDKPVLVEAKAFRATLKAAGHANPSVMWTRVRDAGREYMEGVADEEESNGAKPRKSLQLRLIDDLIKLYKACKREESLSTQQQNAQTSIVSALAALGVDVSTITK